MGSTSFSGVFLPHNLVLFFSKVGIFSQVLGLFPGLLFFILFSVPYFGTEFVSLP